uniref:uncharacterized protein LOC120336824 n=1 Tax=Styela clava TaxID=7725 RepID=UPI001939D98C|nr:uncharacterized protein LOC120336824 [Styela clava]
MVKTSEIQDLVESQVINQYGARGGDLGFRIGGYKANKRWIWIDGTDVPTGKDSKWSTNYQTSSGSMILSSYRSGRSNMTWFTKPNYERRCYICEISGVSQISCFQSGISIKWNRDHHTLGRVYKLYLEDLMSKTSKETNVQILVTDEASITIGNVSEPTPIHCVSSTRLSISPNKYILVDLWAARIRMSLKSVAKVYYIFDESKFKLELVDLS